MKAQIKKFTQEQVVDRVNPKTTRSKWKKIRNVCGIVAAVGALFIPPVQIVALPVVVVKIVTVVTAVSGVIAGRTYLDKKGKNE